MRPLLIARKHLVESLRQPRVLVLGLGLPVAFMLIFGLAFGQGDANETFDLAYVDQDGGELAQAYLSGIENLTYDDGIDLVRLVRVGSEAEAVEGLQARRQDALLLIPQGFTEGLTATTQTAPGGPAGLGQPQTTTTPPAGTHVTVRGDPSFPQFAALSGILESYTAEFERGATGQDPVLQVRSDMVTSRELTGFDFIAPGLMVFAILNLAPQSAAMLARESELGTLDRIRQSPTRAFHLLTGVAGAQLVLAMLSLALMLVTARLMGFQNQGSYLAAYVIALAAAFSVIGLGMIIAAFARTQQEAANLGVLVAIPGSFLSGSFFTIPGVELFTIGERTIRLYDVLPTTHAVDALRLVLTFGNRLEEVAFSLGALVVLSGAFFALGVALYSRTRLRPQ